MQATDKGNGEAQSLQHKLPGAVVVIEDPGMQSAMKLFRLLISAGIGLLCDIGADGSCGGALRHWSRTQASCVRRWPQVTVWVYHRLERRSQVTFWVYRRLEQRSAGLNGLLCQRRLKARGF